MAEYVIILDTERDHCRLFRSDCPETPAGEPLWAGNGLRRGYDEMIRLNKNRRPVKSYAVCSRKNARGRDAFRIFASSPPEDWTALSVHYAWKDARAEASRLAAERDAAERLHKERVRGLMQRVGMNGNRIPRFTDKDLRYVRWLRETGRLAGETLAAAAETRADGSEWLSSLAAPERRAS